MAGVTWVTPVSLGTGGTLSAWSDFDVSAYVPAGATGVICKVYTGATGSFGWRKNGSTDVHATRCYDISHMWFCVGVDANRIFEIYRETVLHDVWLLGYFDDTAAFFTNSPDVTPSTDGTWEDVDISSLTGADTAIAAILRKTEKKTFAYRKNGGTDDRYYNDDSTSGAIIGLDGSEIFEAKLGTYAVLLLNGYITSEVVMHTNGIDVSLSTTDSFIDLPALGSGAGTGGIYESISGSDGQCAFRKNGSTEDELHYLAGEYHAFTFVEADGSGVVEEKINNVILDTFEIGYFTQSSEAVGSARLIGGKLVSDGLLVAGGLVR